MKNKNELHKELLTQLVGAINIELGSYIYDNDWMDWVNTFINKDSNNPKLNIFCNISDGGIDVMLIDDDINYVKNDIIYFRKEELWGSIVLDFLTIGHYHPEDLLWLIFNFKSEIERMKKEIKLYVARRPQVKEYIDKL